MRTVYATQLDLLSKDGRSSQDLFPDLCSRVRRWVEDRYQRKWRTPFVMQVDGQLHAPVQGHTLRATSQAANDASLFTLEWTHPADNDSSTEWITECLVARNRDLVQVAVVLRVSTIRIVLRPVRFDLGRPRLVNELLDTYSATIDGWQVPQEIESLTSPTVHPFVQNVLLNAQRNLPIIMVSPDVWNGGYAVDPATLLQRLRGFAHVSVLADKWAAYKLTDVVEKRLSCYAGAIRIYWPEFALSDNPFQHKLFLPDSIRRFSEGRLPLQDHLFRLLAGVTAYRYTEGRAIHGARQAIAELDRKRASDLREQVEKGELAKEGLERQLLEALGQIEELSGERRRLQDELKAQKAAWTQVQQSIHTAEDLEPERTQEVSELMTVGQVLAKAKKSASNALVYLDSAVVSAGKSPFKNTERLAELLEAIDLVASEWRKKKGALGQSWEHAFENLGFEYSDKVSMTSKGKWKSEYEFNYGGKKRIFEKHITIGSGQPDTCLSVHWYRDDTKLELVIRHCGRHLTNTSS